MRNSSDTRNLLELTESHGGDLSATLGLSETATCGEKSRWSSPTEHSLCSDDVIDQSTIAKSSPGLDNVRAVCADD
jgi:hypothetical protein